MLEFYKGKRVLVTGHTGFKGSWLCTMLIRAGAKVAGYALEPPTVPSLFELAQIEPELHSVIGDIRNLSALDALFEEFRPEIVFHLAAQPIVGEGYRDPVSTYAINVMGTVNLLDCVRRSKSVVSVLNVTTDKVYENKEWAWGYRETDPLNGSDPYSNSKSCSELVTHGYTASFLKETGVLVSTARAGNVIGGGDFAPDRIIPDCIRSAASNQACVLRNPGSVRPFQHVLEPLSAYLLLTEKQALDPSLCGSYNVGPRESDCITAGRLAELFCKAWGEGASWNAQGSREFQESVLLKLDCSKIQAKLGWHPVWTIEEAVQKTVAWAKTYHGGGDVRDVMVRQIDQYLEDRLTQASLM